MNEQKEMHRSTLSDHAAKIECFLLALASQSWKQAAVTVLTVLDKKSFSQAKQFVAENLINTEKSLDLVLIDNV